MRITFFWVCFFREQKDSKAAEESKKESLEFEEFWSWYKKEVIDAKSNKKERQLLRKYFYALMGNNCTLNQLPNLCEEQLRLWGISNIALRRFIIQQAEQLQ